MDENIAQEGGVDPIIPTVIGGNDSLEERSSIEIPEMDIVLHRRSKSPDQDHPLFGSTSKRTN